MKRLFYHILASVIALSAMSLGVRAVDAETNDSGLSEAPGVDISVQSLFGIITGLACWATRFVMILMVVMIVWYGFQMMIAGGSDTKFTTARKSLGYAVVGILVIMGAYTIIATVGNAVENLDNGATERSAKYTLFVPLNCSRY